MEGFFFFLPGSEDILEMNCQNKQIWALLKLIQLVFFFKLLWK